MKVVIAGTTTFSDYQLLCATMDDLFGNTRLTVISGKAAGADTLGEQYARERGYELVEVPANWKKYGRAAGPLRNRKMAELADAVVVFWDGKSRGSRSMISEARKLNRKIHIIEYGRVNG